jgi:hypothetical protein
VAGEAKSEVSPCSSSQRLSIIGIKNSVVAACRRVDSRTSLRMKVVSVVQLKRTEHLPLVGILHPKERAVLYGNTDPRAKKGNCGDSRMKLQFCSSDIKETFCKSILKSSNRQSRGEPARKRSWLNLRRRKIHLVDLSYH